jgi:hypothetical protein
MEISDSEWSLKIIIIFYLCKINIFFYYSIINHSNSFNLSWIPSNAGYFQNDNRYSPLKPLKSLAEFNSRVCMSVCDSVCVCVCVFMWEVRVCKWRGEFYRVVLVVQLGFIFHFILHPEQRRVFQLVL